MAKILKLFKKDVLVMKDYGIRYFVLVFIVSAAISISSGASSLYFLMPLMFSRYFLTSILHEEDKNKGYMAMLLLPVNRRDLVLEKYVFVIFQFLLGFLAALLISFLGGRIGIYKGDRLTPGINFIALSFFLNMLIDGVRIPITFKLTAAKAGVFNALTLILYMTFMVLILTQEVREYILGIVPFLNNPGALAVVFFILSGVVLAVTYRISLSIMEKKDF